MKAAGLNPLHVLGHQPPRTNADSPTINDQEDMENAPINVDDNNSRTKDKE